jgi:hypothetical protein
LNNPSQFSPKSLSFSPSLADTQEGEILGGLHRSREKPQALLVVVWLATNETKKKKHKGHKTTNAAEIQFYLQTLKF